MKLLVIAMLTVALVMSAAPVFADSLDTKYYGNRYGSGYGGHAKGYGYGPFAGPGKRLGHYKHGPALGYGAAFQAPFAYRPYNTYGGSSYMDKFEIGKLHGIHGWGTPYGKGRAWYQGFIHGLHGWY